MSDKLVRSHTNVSNRAKAKDTFERRSVYKSVLDNPFTVPWPKVPTNVQNAIVSQTVAALDGVAAYHTRPDRNGKRKTVREHDRKKKRKTILIEGGDKELEISSASMGDSPMLETENIGSTNSHPSASAPTLVDAPDILRHITFGINEVTKKLEALAHRLHHDRLKITSEPLSASDSAQIPTSQIVLACTGDVNPPILVQHIPNLVAACNSARAKTDDTSTWLLPLPAGSEHILSTAAGLRRVCVLMLDSTSPNFDLLLQFVGNVTILRASWLLPPAHCLSQGLVPTHIKQLKTTAPKDMKAVKEARVKRRAEAKVRRKSKMATKAGVQ